jgi:hypothetical protein
MRSSPGQQNQTANPAPQEQVAVAESIGGSTTQPEQTDIVKLNDDELVNTLGEAQKAEKVVENAKKQLSARSKQEETENLNLCPTTAYI